MPALPVIPASLCVACRMRTLCLALTAVVISIAGLSSGVLLAQPETRYVIKDSREIMPSEMGFELPDGDVAPFSDGNVSTTDEEGRGCVARVHARVGEDLIVLLPDGQLAARRKNQISATEREFKAMTGEEMGNAIVKDRLKGFRVLTTERFVFVYNTTPEFAKVTSTVMETMLTGVIEFCREMGLDVHEPEVPLLVIMFHRAQHFHAYQPMPPGILAYYEIPTNRVVLHEESGLAGLSVELARQELLSTIAHEGAHQILHNIGVQQRLSRWPMWIGEGIAEYLAPTKPGHKFAWKGAGKINDLRMWELEGFLQRQFIKGFDGDTVNQTVSAGVLDSTGYASAWTLTYFLAEKRKEDFDRYVRYLSRMPPLQGMLPAEKGEEPTVPGNMVHFQKFFAEDLEAFEKEMVEHMSRQKFESPFGALPHFVGTVEIPDVNGAKRHACFYIDKGSLAEWHSTVMESMTTYEKEHARFQFLQFRDRGEANQYIRKWKREK